MANSRRIAVRLAVGCVMLLALCELSERPASASPPEEDLILWEESLDAAMSRCAREDKPVFISFSTRKGGDPDAPFY